MSRKRYLSIKNFDAAQMYKDRNPIWIKLHCAILDDYEFSAIADETKFHAVGLMLLASRLNNKFPDDARWLRTKINANSEINIEKLIEIGFLEVAKDETIVCKSKKTKDKSVKQLEKLCNTEQNRTEEKRTEHNTTQQSANVEADEDAQSRVVVVDFNSSQNGKPKTEEDDKDSSSSVGASSMFSLADCLRYAEQSTNVINPAGLANNLFKTGSADSFILAKLYPEKVIAETIRQERETFGEPIQFTSNPCAVCFGARMADVGGKGFAKCVHCRNERGQSTGFEPQGETNDEE